MARNLEVQIAVLILVLLLAPVEAISSSCSASCSCKALCGRMVVKNFGTIYRCSSCSSCTSLCASRCASKVSSWSKYSCGGNSRGERIRPYYSVYSYTKGYYYRSYVCGYRHYG